MEQQVVDRIYECAFAPEFWPDVLDELAKMTEARGGVFFSAQAGAGVMRWTASKGVFTEATSYFSGQWFKNDDRRSRLVNSRHAGFLTDHDIFTEQELEEDPTYRGFFRPQNYAWQAATGVPLPTGDWFIFTVGRDYSRGPIEAPFVEQLDAIRPHLARSALMSARLQFERARAASESLALIGLPALVFDERGRVLAANQLIEALHEHILWCAQDRLVLKDAGANALFHQAIETLSVADAAPTRSFAVRRRDAAAMVAHVVPIRRSARDIFVRCAGVLVLTPVTLPQAPPVDLIKSLFDLTPAEARVARSLVAGNSIEDIAATGSVSRNTVRSQLRGVLEKTGCRRQAEIVALLGGIAAPGNV